MEYKKLDVTQPITVKVIGNHNHHCFPIGSIVRIFKYDFICDWRGHRYSAESFGGIIQQLCSMDFIVANNKIIRGLNGNCS